MSNLKKDRFVNQFNKLQSVSVYIQALNQNKEIDHIDIIDYDNFTENTIQFTIWFKKNSDSDKIEAFSDMIYSDLKDVFNLPVYSFKFKKENEEFLSYSSYLISY